MKLQCSQISHFLVIFCRPNTTVSQPSHFAPQTAPLNSQPLTISISSQSNIQSCITILQQSPHHRHQSQSISTSSVIHKTMPFESFPCHCNAQVITYSIILVPEIATTRYPAGLFHFLTNQRLRHNGISKILEPQEHFQVLRNCFPKMHKHRSG